MLNKDKVSLTVEGDAVVSVTISDSMAAIGAVSVGSELINLL